MLATIDHLVVLMLENRYFDHMLGFLKSAEYPIEGLGDNQSNLGHRELVRVTQHACFAACCIRDNEDTGRNSCRAFAGT